MFRRLIHGLMVLWGTGACLLLVGGKILFADPGDCNQDCREVLVEGRNNTDPPSMSCFAVKYKECQACAIAGNGGCWSDNPKADGTCQPKKTVTQETDNQITCKILCSNPRDFVLYEAHTNDTPKYVPFGYPYTCQPSP